MRLSPMLLLGASLCFWGCDGEDGVPGEEPPGAAAHPGSVPALDDAAATADGQLPSEGSSDASDAEPPPGHGDAAAATDGSQGAGDPMDATGGEPATDAAQPPPGDAAGGGGRSEPGADIRPELMLCIEEQGLELVPQASLAEVAAAIAVIYGQCSPSEQELAALGALLAEGL